MAQEITLATMFLSRKSAFLSQLKHRPKNCQFSIVFTALAL